MTIEELKELKKTVRAGFYVDDTDGDEEFFKVINQSDEIRILELIDEKISQMQKEPRVKRLSCWYCTGIESHGIKSVKTVTDKLGRELNTDNTPYNYCPNCSRKLR